MRIQPLALATLVVLIAVGCSKNPLDVATDSEMQVLAAKPDDKPGKPGKGEDGVVIFEIWEVDPEVNPYCVKFPEAGYQPYLSEEYISLLHEKFDWENSYNYLIYSSLKKWTWVYVRIESANLAIDHVYASVVHDRNRNGIYDWRYETHRYANLHGFVNNDYSDYLSYEPGLGWMSWDLEADNPDVYEGFLFFPWLGETYNWGVSPHTTINYEPLSDRYNDGESFDQQFYSDDWFTFIFGMSYAKDRGNPISMESMRPPFYDSMPIEDQVAKFTGPVPQRLIYVDLPDADADQISFTQTKRNGKTYVYANFEIRFPAVTPGSDPPLDGGATELAPVTVYFEWYDTEGNLISNHFDIMSVDETTAKVRILMSQGQTIDFWIKSVEPKLPWHSWDPDPFKNQMTMSITAP